MPRPPSTTAAAACALLLSTWLLVACGGGADPTDSGSQGGSENAPTGSTATESGDDDEDDNDDEDDEPEEGDPGFDWTDWGPSDPPIPGQYAALAQAPPDCGSAEAEAPTGEYWQTVLAVCRAVTGQGPWPEATALPPPPAADNAFQACLDGELSAAVDAALRWHAANPGGTPQVTYGGGSSLSPCQTAIYEVRVLTDSDLFDEESPPAGAGVLITLALRDDEDRDSLPVTVDGEPVPHSFEFREVQPDGVGLASFVVLVPDHLLSPSATITVQTARGDLTTMADLGAGATVEPSTQTSTGSTATDTATETPTETPTESPSVEPPDPAETTGP